MNEIHFNHSKKSTAKLGRAECSHKIKRIWLTSTPYFDDICNKTSDGATNRNRLQSDRFYSQELLIPEEKYQHELVKKLKSPDEKIKIYI